MGGSHIFSGQAQQGMWGMEYLDWVEAGTQLSFYYSEGSFSYYTTYWLEQLENTDKENHP